MQAEPVAGTFRKMRNYLTTRGIGQCRAFAGSSISSQGLIRLGRTSFARGWMYGSRARRTPAQGSALGGTGSSVDSALWFPRDCSPRNGRRAARGAIRPGESCGRGSSACGNAGRRAYPRPRPAGAADHADRVAVPRGRHEARREPFHPRVSPRTPI